MASGNLFKREAKTLESIGQEIQRSEAPTGAIGKLSSKVRKMVDAVASRIRGVVGGSSDVAKAAVLAAAATHVPAHAGQEFQPNQPLGNNLQTQIKIDTDEKDNPFIFGCGVVQDGDNHGGFISIQSQSTTNSVGGSLTVLDDTAQLSASFARNFPYKHIGSTTLGGQVLVNQTDAESVYKTEGTLRGYQVDLRSSTTFDGSNSIDFNIKHQQAGDTNLFMQDSIVSSTQSVIDTGSTIDTVQTNVINTIRRDYIGGSRSEGSFGLTHRFDDNHQAISLATKYIQSEQEEQNFAGKVRYQIANGAYNAQITADDLGQLNPTYSTYFAHDIGSHGALGLSISKKEGEDPGVSLVYTYHFDGDRGITNRSLANTVTETPANMVAQFNRDSQNMNTIRYKEIGKLEDSSSTRTEITKLKSEEKTTITVPEKVTLKAGGFAEIEVIISGSALPDVSSKGQVLAQIIDIKEIAGAQPTGLSSSAVGVALLSEGVSVPSTQKRYIVKISAPATALADGSVIVKAGNTQEIILVDVIPQIVVDSPTKIANPIVSVGDEEVKVANPFIDQDGMRNITYVLNDAQGELISKNTTGLFVTPTLPGVYNLVISGEALNAKMGVYEIVKTEASFEIKKSIAVDAPTLFTEPKYEVRVTEQAPIIAKNARFASFVAATVSPSLQLVVLDPGINDKDGVRNVNYTLVNDATGERTETTLSTITLEDGIYTLIVSAEVYVPSLANPDGTYGGYVRRLNDMQPKIEVTTPVIVDTPTSFKNPTVTIVDGVITAMSSGITDADGEGAEVIYANGEPITEGTQLKPGTYTITSQREVNENGIMVVKDNGLVGELVVEAPKVNAPTTYNEPILSINQDTNTVSIKNMGDLVKDLDGVKDVTVYLEADGVRIGNNQGLYANVLTSTSADVAYTISADYLAKNGITGKYEPGTYTFTKKAVLSKEAPADTTPPSKVSENLIDIGVAGVDGYGTMTLSEDIASVSDAKFVDAKTGATLSGGAVSVSVDPTNAKVVKVDYTIGNSYEWAIHGIKLVFYVQDNAGNVSTIESNSYEVN